MRLEETEIRRYLCGGFGRALTVYESLPSTNDTAKLLAQKGARGAAFFPRRMRAFT